MKILTEKLNIKNEYNIRNISSPEEMLLFDIETTGLKKETTQIYLIGCGTFEDEETIVITQWLAQSALDEREVLESFLEFARNYKMLVHFNGDGFDIPYVRYKADYYGMDFDIASMESVDIYKKSKAVKKLLGLERLNQKSVEAFLKVEREDEMNGGLLIPYFYEYERSGDSEAERLLLLHNFDDVKGMFKIIKMLSYPDMTDGKFKFRHKEIFDDTLILEYELENPVPVPFENKENEIWICAENDLLQINVGIYRGTALIPVENPQDYFYLPDEDIIVHKDVAMFVDKSHRKKATKKNAFLKKEGAFVRNFRDDIGFLIPGEGKKKGHCIEVEDLMKKSDEEICEYALEILKSF